AGFCDGSGAAATCTVTETIVAPASITVGVTATVNGEATITSTVSCTLNGTLTYTTAASPSPSPSPTGSAPATGRVIIGYGNKCVDDNGNSSANKAKVGSWTCNTSDKAQLWTNSGGELI